MTAVTEHLRPEEGSSLSREDFARAAGLPREQVAELLDYGLLSPQKLYLSTALALREAARLRQDFDLDIFSTGLLAGYIEKIHELQSELRRAQAERPVRTIVTDVVFTSVQVVRHP